MQKKITTWERSSNDFSSAHNGQRYYDTLDDTKITCLVDQMKKKYIAYWKHSLCNSQKLEFYNNFKDSYTPSPYLDLTRKNPNRKTLVKLRISNHKLLIETERYNIPRSDRLCTICGHNVEDETHLLFHCPRYSSLRDNFFSKIQGWTLALAHSPRRVSKLSGEYRSPITCPFWRVRFFSFFYFPF